MKTPGFVWFSCLVLCAMAFPAHSQTVSAGTQRVAPTLRLKHFESSRLLPNTGVNDRDIAARFAPIFYQALGDKPRSDYITNFDFDGDWRGNNNWEHADDQAFPLRGFIYYAVSETPTHFFIHYAAFHPRDYKGGETKGVILSEIIREGVKLGSKNDPSGLMAEVGVAHENDLEGALVVVARNGNNLKRAEVVFVETLHHDDFSAYVPGDAVRGFGRFKTEGDRVLLYVEPKGHGIEPYVASDKQVLEKQFLIYKFAARADDPDKQKSGSVGYDLISIKDTLWPKARMRSDAPGITYGTSHDYAEISISLVQPNGSVAARTFKVGQLGDTFAGDFGGTNKARPPWAWFNKSRRGDALGLWFFDPATIVKRDFNLGQSFSTAYSQPPFWATE